MKNAIFGLTKRQDFLTSEPKGKTRLFWYPTRTRKMVPKPDRTFRYFCTENPETWGKNPTFLIPDPNPRNGTRPDFCYPSTSLFWTEIILFSMFQVNVNRYPTTKLTPAAPRKQKIRISKLPSQGVENSFSNLFNAIPLMGASNMIIQKNL